ncbi:MAG: glutamyl-tRNA synthetase, glutamyl-tRNA synthetase [Candidatus Adlerbacteria bacterium]|nr:glutamyl-tRNA synthetase, glutamyl-tRNA synthetase [Candidatus Adlerbacteria bacterium]
MSQPVITRFPPSPTGLLHIGGARTALFNYLFAAHNGGKMILRFEDTDKERSKPEFEQDILDVVHWLGIPYETPPVYRQSERLSVYQGHVARLVDAGMAYEAEESENNPGKKVVRFKNPNSVITFADAVREQVTFDTTDLGDFVIARSIDEPLYHLAVVIDDHDMGVTHVIRGEEHISNTPRQILILEALGFARPEYAHVPLILAPDKSKLSKRHGAVSATDYRAQGFIPEAIINYLALLGWNPGGEQEVFTLEELVKLFTLERIHKAGAVFGTEKLLWFNHEHLKRLSDQEYGARLKDFSKSEFDARLVPLIKERAQTLTEATDLIKEYDFTGDVSCEPALLLNKGKIAAEDASKHLQAVQAIILGVADEDFTAAHIKDAVWPYAEQEGRGAVLWPLRVALSGREKSPDPFTIAALVGKDETLKRIARAAESF